MLKDEFMNRFDDLSKSDNLQSDLLQLRGDIESIFEERESLNSEIDKLNSKVSNLQDTNQRLYLQITQETVSQGQEEHEETIDEWYQRIGGGE